MKAAKRRPLLFTAARFLSLSLALWCLPWHASGQTKLAGTEIRSDEWIIRREKGEEEFKGNVSLKQPGTAINADWALFNKNEQSWLLRGSVHGKRALKNQNEVEVWAHEMRHEIEGKKSQAQGRPGNPLRFKHVSTQTITGEALQADWEDAAGLLTLQKRVKLEGQTFRTKSETALISHQNKINLTGGPPILHAAESTWETEIQAEEIEFDQKDKGLKTKGRTKGWIHWSSKPKI